MTADVKRPQPDALTGQVLAGRYKVIDLIARGGMGRIYRAEQIELGRLVALKILDDTTDDPEGFRKRFTLEAATSARLSHPNIVIVHDYGSFELDDTRRYFMALELIDGVTLGTIVKQRGLLEPGRAAWIAREILRALREAHRQGVVHRDLKPSNVMLMSRTDGEHVKVLDFGIAKVLQHDGAEEITREGAFVGTPRYMSPEQLSSGPVDARSDLYSVGVLIFQMLTGKPPHAAKDMMQAMVAHLTEGPAELPEAIATTTPDALRAVLRKALQREPRDRFQDASEFLRALEAAASGLPGWAGPAHAVAEASGAGERTPATGERPSAQVPIPRVSIGEDVTAAHTPSARSVVAATAVTEPGDLATARRGRALLWIAASLGAAALLALAGVVLWPRGETGVTATTPGPAERAPAPTESGSTGVAREAERPDPTPSPEAPATFVLVVNSEPSGATLYRDGAALGTTPISIELRSDSLTERPAQLLVELANYGPFHFEQGPSTSDVTVHAALVPMRAATTPHRTRTPHREGTSAPPPPEDRLLKTSR